MLGLVFQIPTLNQGFWYYADGDFNVGDLVLIPFRNSFKYGIIFELISNSAPRYREILKSLEKVQIKSIEKIIWHNIIAENFISFLRQASNYNCIDFVKILNIAFPSYFIKFITATLKLKKDKKIELKEVRDFNQINLNSHQEDIYQKLKQKIDYFSVNVINGITGSGKTSIFLKLTQNIIQNNKKVLILVPEIALSKHISMAIEKFTGIKPFIWNSDIRSKDKKEYLEHILSSNANIFLGTRSSLFLPYKNLGLIVIDEEHDSSYKQNESPVYHARDMAILRAMKEDIPIILSSATLSIETKVNIQNDKFQEYVLSNRFFKTDLPNINIEKTNFSKENLINDNILNEIYENFKNKKQTLIFLNRRGFSRSIFCKNCKESPKCENCDNILSYHKNKSILKCHYCGFHVKFDNLCLKCFGQDIREYGGYGVEKINNFIEDFFLQKNEKINIQIVSSDIMNKNNIEEILNDIHSEKTNIIIGTEVISKGYHFSNLNLVVILDFNSLSNEEGDIRMNERIFQLVTQISGRAGREKENGKILIQIDRESKVFAFIKNYDQNGFYNFEIENRKKFNLPPFTKFIAVIISAESKEKAIKITKQFEALLKDKIANLIERKKIINFDDKAKILGPSESFLHFLKRSYRYRFLLKIKDFSLLNEIKKILQEIGSDKNIKIDVDPLSFL